ncbi:5'-deoxynucleotidase YfbR [Sinobacterium norvegicum]|uniref:5'-deoxynucleotidase YfbR n=1 Tax=Sinobacterium norvegicum TaxID=1641715 RepID=A0ABN8EK63_9GAMM|nr:5'-deoxynucleotidase [Sinobacterium norvegicum]CAH0992789.1 5'-deoxynucleotidase YfbR [Sinobacterium norvegicum]
MTSHFFAYISKIRWIQRWGLKRNTVKENVMEHSWEVATISHCLALLRNRLYGGNIDANAVATAALYHDCTEVITGDMPTPIKYHSKAIKEAYKAIERSAEQELLQLLPEPLQADYSTMLIEENIDPEIKSLIKAADTISAYIKCQAEIISGNIEFNQAAKDIALRLSQLSVPEVDYFLATFVPSYQLTLDELLKPLSLDD